MISLRLASHPVHPQGRATQYKGQCVSASPAFEPNCTEISGACWHSIITNTEKQVHARDMLDNSQCNDMPERKSAAQVKVVNRGSAKWCPLTDAEDSDQQFGLKV